MSFLSKIFNKETGSVIRNLVRAVIIVVTAFGFDLTGEQVGAIMLAVEAAFGLGVASPIGN